MKYLAPIPKQFVDHNGLPLSDGSVHVYISRDTQYANVYQDADGEELVPNPVRLDSNGAWQGFVTASIPMDYVVEDKDGNVQFEYEKVTVPSGEEGGGGGGSDVIVEQVLTEGTKIADVFVDGEHTPLYAPTPLGLGETSTTAYPGDMGKAAYDLANSKADPASVVDSVVYDSANHVIVFKHGQTQLFTLDVAAFVKDGMVDSVTISNGNLVITFNTDAGKQPISIPLTDIFNPDNYYTKTATNTLLAGKQDAMFVKFEFDSTLYYADVATALYAGKTPYLLDGRTMFICDGSAYQVEVSGSNTTEYRFVAAVGNTSSPKIVYRYVRADNSKGVNSINLALYSNISNLTTSINTLSSDIETHNKYFHTEVLNVTDGITRFLKISFSGRVGRASAIVSIGANNGNDSSAFRLSWFYDGSNPIGNFRRELFSTGDVSKKPLVYYDSNSLYIGLSDSGNWVATISVMLACENPQYVSYSTVTRAVAMGSDKTNLPLQWVAVYSQDVTTIVKGSLGSSPNTLYIL